MDFPKRIKQHKSQSDSFAILLYRLRDVGIFRSATDNDYGIDFEIEVVHKERVVGRYLKAQVKSSEDLTIRQDGVPTVGGIKQSTLLYWAELSYRANVIAFAVDLKTESVYVSKPLFWQATALLDKTESTKTIEFLPAINFKEIDPENKLNTEEHKKKFENYYHIQLLKAMAFGAIVPDIIYAHKTILRNFKNIFELYSDTWHYDAWTEVQMLDTFKTFLESAKLLIDSVPEAIDGVTPEERNNLFNFEYWSRKTNWGTDEVSNHVAQTPLKILMPLLLDKVQKYNKDILEAKYYWKQKDIPYLKLVHSVIVPSSRTHEEISKVGYNLDQLHNDDSFNSIQYGD